MTIDRQRIEQVKRFKYLGSIISEDGRSHIDVKTKTALAKNAFSRRKKPITKELSTILKGEW